MANGVQLATAYISLNVRTDDIKKQVSSALSGVGGEGRRVGTSIGSNIVAGIRNHMGNSSLATMVFAPMEVAGIRWAVKAGAAIGGALKKALLSAASLTGVGSIFAVGGLLTAGLDRLKTIQRAQVQLSLRLPPEEIKRVTKDIQDVVRGTPIPLDEALQAVPRALSAGIKPGKELNQYIKDIADTAASTGGQAGFGQIDIIFSQILGKGKLMGEELMQLTENGVDLRNALKNTFNWDDKKLNSMVAKGKVGMKEIQKAVEETWGKNGGLSKLMGNTFDGAMGNLKASAARLGANILDVIFGNPKNSDDPLKGAIDGVTALTGKLDTAGKWVAAHKEDIRGYFNGAKDTAIKLADTIKTVWDWMKRTWTAAEDLGSKIGDAFDRGRSAVGNLWTKASETFGKIKTKVSDIFDDLKKKFDSVFGPDGWFAQQFDKLGKIVDKVRDVLGLGSATANAAAPDAAPFNPGPLAPGQVPPGAKVVPGTIGPGSGGTLGVPQAAVPGSMYPGDQGLLSRVQPGTYVSEPGVGDLTKGIGDCTSSIEDLVNILEGKSTAGRSLATGNADEWLTQHGFVPTDKPVPGSFQVGFFNDPSAPGGGHMQATLPGGTKFNWGSDASAANRGVGDSGAWDDPRFNKHYFKKYGSGGRINGPGSGTSDSIPAMLSNGEHVLTASDVQKMGGQNGVYAFRQALQAGLIPGFAPGGAVDPSQIQNANDNIADLTNQAAIAKSKWDEIQSNPDASESEKRQATQDMVRTQRMLDQAQAALPFIQAGQSPPDMSKQNRVYDLTDQLANANQSLKDLQDKGDASNSQLLQAQYSITQTQRERDQAIAELTGQGKQPDYGQGFLRSLGFIPSGASSTGVPGTSSLSGFINMGNSVVSGVIDTGVNLANQAVSAAIAAGATAGSFGAGVAAAPIAQMAASYGIQLAGNEAKRISQYWFGLAGIGADSLMEIFSPFGAPRWLGYDYSSMVPQLGIQQAALGTLEQMSSDAINKYFAGQQNPVIPPDPSQPNTAPSGPAAGTMQVPLNGPAQATAPQGGMPQPGTVDTQGMFNTDPFRPDLIPPTGAGGVGGGGSWARGGHVGIYDNGGVLGPGQLAFNASRTPESILTKQQWNAMAANASTKSKDSAPLVQNLYAQDMQDAIRQLEKVKRRDMMQYAGRP